MSIITLDGNGQVNYSFGPQISFALVSSPAEGRKILTPFYTCRDYINDTLMAYFNKMPNSFWGVKTTIPLDETKLRLVIARDLCPNQKEEDLRKLMYSAKRVINIYEGMAGFKSRSVISRIKYSKDRENSIMRYSWLLTSPKEWLKSSHLVSLITLTFRIITNHGGFEEVTTFEDLMKVFKSLPQGSWDCRTMVMSILPILPTLLKQYDELFGENSFEFWYPRDRVAIWHSGGGIVSLCTYSTGAQAIDNLIKEAYKGT